MTDRVEGYASDGSGLVLEIEGAVILEAEVLEMAFGACEHIFFDFLFAFVAHLIDDPFPVDAAD
jgi:hypothetical protein